VFNVWHGEELGYNDYMFNVWHGEELGYNDYMFNVWHGEELGYNDYAFNVNRTPSGESIHKKTHKTGKHLSF
jgi:hypothetical protein